MYVVDGQKLAAHGRSIGEALRDIYARELQDVYALSVTRTGGVCVDYYFDGIEELQFQYRCDKDSEVEAFVDAYHHVISNVQAETRCIDERDKHLDCLVHARIYATRELNGLTPLDSRSSDIREHCPHISSGKDEIGEFCFQSMDDIGFYLIVPDAHWFEFAASCGVRTIQLRAKDKPVSEVENMVKRCSEVAVRYGVRFIVNDYWELALKYNAYGIHLGQEDIKTADLCRISSSGIRLGISTHCYHEFARASFYKPSYIALGPIYDTTSKSMQFHAQGLELLKQWVKSSSCPVVAIGGITLANIDDVVRCNAGGVAVISAVTEAADPKDAIRRFLDKCSAGV
ncbi:Thiamine-phosphate synthase [Anaplasma phagocytophilum]|uniref:Thiamine-phosphate synthase n=1 Tax=Anaplasma phagocytophilum TaxID=948 RepID=A0AA45US85_ANAPH|nr:thiamine phosphate synthase [Anaplasma phagocytophilum]SBO13770.1 Thiamine-phosphate synthase [Anaplasma phagocytophilum]